MSSLLSSISSTGNLVAVPDAISAHVRSKNDDGGRNIFVDGSWHMPMGPSPRNARSEFISGPRVPGAVYFDIDDVSSPHPSSLPHMRPSSTMFARAMDRMGISPEDTVYVYATEGCAFAHRAYWTFAFGGYHDPRRVKLVQGSLDEWVRCGGMLEREAILEGDRRLFRVSELIANDDGRLPRYVPFRKDYGGAGDRSVVDVDVVLEVVDGSATDASTTIVDARSAGRFHGRDSEPRPGLRGGHIPGSINVPFVSLLDPTDVTKFKPMNEVRAIFVEAGIEPLVTDGDDDARPRRIICTCGSGVTAAALAVALEECGLREKGEISLFDGSWIEWGGRDDTPIATD
jgi:thiosulfate/3-mercaptopyruvate sulfurtransferase